MPLPTLGNWEATAHSLHKAAQMLGVLRMVRLPHVPNYLEMGLKIKPEGLSTDVLPGGAEVTLDFGRASFIARQPGAPDTTISLASQDQGAALTGLLGALKGGELAAVLRGVEESRLVETFLDAAVKAGHDLSSPENQISGDGRLEIDAQIGRSYAEALYRIFTGVARFRARLTGPLTPVVVWPGHFDLSFLWFATAHAEESAPHMNFGFAPYGGGVDEPYLYAYAYPMPPDSDDPATLPGLPAPARWHLKGWKGVVLLYGEISRAADPEGYVEAMCEAIYRALRPLLG